MSNIGKELKAWISFMLGNQTLFNRIDALIIENRHLIKDDKEVNTAIDNLIKHISGYKLVFKMWSKGDYSRMTSWNNFPSELNHLIPKKIKELEDKINEF